MHRSTHNKICRATQDSHILPNSKGILHNTMSDNDMGQTETSTIHDTLEFVVLWIILLTNSIPVCSVIKLCVSKEGLGDKVTVQTNQTCGDLLALGH